MITTPIGPHSFYDRYRTPIKGLALTFLATTILSALGIATTTGLPFTLSCVGLGVSVVTELALLRIKRSSSPPPPARKPLTPPPHSSSVGPGSSSSQKIRDQKPSGSEDPVMEASIKASLESANGHWEGDKWIPDAPTSLPSSALASSSSLLSAPTPTLLPPSSALSSADGITPAAQQTSPSYTKEEVERAIKAQRTAEAASRRLQAAQGSARR